MIFANGAKVKRPGLRDDRGISTLWIALIFLFLNGSAALAIDISGAFNTAQTDQNTADLACLAGVRELPDQTDAINTAVAYIDANWPDMVGATLTVTLPTATYDAGNGNSVFLHADYGGSGDEMLIRTREITKTAFGKTLGQDTITVSQEAACWHQPVRIGAGMFPVGALPGSWNGDLFDCAAKITGNCGALAPYVPGANAYRDAVANGIEGNFIKHHGNATLIDPDTGYATVDCLADPCNVAESEPGNMVGPWNEALSIRLANITGADCVDNGWFNCDSINQVFGVGLQPLGAIPEPAWWENSLYGTFANAAAAVHPSAQHYYYNGSSMKCDSPRLGSVPIVARDQHWDLGDIPGTWPAGREDMKMVGFYTVYIREPDDDDDLGGPIDADIIWFGPNADCGSGEAFQAFASPVAVETDIRLVAP